MIKTNIFQQVSLELNDFLKHGFDICGTTMHPYRNYHGKCTGSEHLNSTIRGAKPLPLIKVGKRQQG